MKRAFLIAGMILTVIGIIWGASTEIEWTVYLGFPLVILFGGIGITFITKRIEGVISGLVLAAIWPALWELLKSAITSI